MASMDDLTLLVAAEPDVGAATALLVNTLAGQIKATSNDQNIQKLARDLKAAAPALVSAIARKPMAMTTD